VTRASLVAVAARYRRFPLLTSWSGLLNVGSLQLPSILFSAGFGAAAAGLYALSFKMLVLPTMLVAQAVGQVFLSRAATVAREPERLRQLTERTALALFACGLPVFAAVAVGGPQLFATVMGSQWEQAGRYAQVLAPWFVVWLVSNPLSGMLSGAARRESPRRPPAQARRSAARSFVRKTPPTPPPACVRRTPCPA